MLIVWEVLSTADKPLVLENREAKKAGSAHPFLNFEGSIFYFYSKYFSGQFPEENNES